MTEIRLRDSDSHGTQGCRSADEPLVVVVQGPTASGKTELAHRLADVFPMEIISADSRQVWSGLDIGTAKPPVEERHRYRYHGVDICTPDRRLSAGEFAHAAWQWIADIHRRGQIPLVVGGSGLYVRAIVEGLFEQPGDISPTIRSELQYRLARDGRDALYEELARIDPESAARYSDRNPRRLLRALEFYYTHGIPLSLAQRQHRIEPPPMHVVRLTLLPNREHLYSRIEHRTTTMWRSGLLDEVRRLLDSGYQPTAPAFETIGYAEAIAVIEGRMTLPDAIEHTALRTRHYAKRQYTWLRHATDCGTVFPSFGSDVFAAACTTIESARTTFIEQRP